MFRIEKQINIDVPVEEVFNYWTNPVNRPEVWPSLIEIRDVEASPDGVVTHFGWVYKMAGIQLEGTTEMLECIPNHRYVEQSKGGVDSTLTWTFTPQKGMTRMAVRTEYSVPVPVVGKLAETVIAKLNEREAETILANIKTRLEVES